MKSWTNFTLSGPNGGISPAGRKNVRPVYPTNKPPELICSELSVNALEYAVQTGWKFPGLPDFYIADKQGTRIFSYAIGNPCRGFCFLFSKGHFKTLWRCNARLYKILDFLYSLVYLSGIHFWWHCSFNALYNERTKNIYRKKIFSFNNRLTSYTSYLERW